MESFLEAGFKPMATCKTPWSTADQQLLESGILELHNTPALMNGYKSIYKYLSQVTMGSSRTPKHVALRIKFLSREAGGAAGNQASNGQDEMEEEEVEDGDVIVSQVNS